ncbi:hypothetical protein HK104_007486, partial [Borealophlyctis nickersoniae]
ASTVKLPNGRIAVIGGVASKKPEPSLEFIPPSPDCPYGPECLVQINLLQTLGADGRLFILANTRSVILDPSKSYMLADTPGLPLLGISPTKPLGPSRTYPLSAGSVLLPLSEKNGWRAEVLVCGGSEKASRFPRLAPTLDWCGRMAPEDTEPDWEYERMSSGRVMPDLILLPDKKVLLLNGAHVGMAGFNGADKPALQAMLYDPEAPLGDRWRPLNSSTIPRMCKSSPEN